MIGKLTGLVESIEKNNLIINVNDVGYIVHCSAQTLSHLRENEKTSLLIETIVREDSFELYGFLDKIEQNVFVNLTKVSGVGKKLGLSILSSMKPELVINAIKTGEASVLRSVPGVGPKMAERLVMELKNTFKDSNITISHIAKSGKNTQLTSAKNNIMEDAISALSNLGVNNASSYSNMQKALEENPDIKLDQLIKIGLKKTY